MLYNILFEKSGKRFLVDSSKSPQYILVLNKLPFEVKILHLTRRFSGVLNSGKKEIKKNSRDGVEKDLKPCRFNYILITWILDNFFSFVYSTGQSYKRVKYENLISNPLEVLNSIHKLNYKERKLFTNKRPLKAHHLVAGNKMRMGNEISIGRDSGFEWENNVTTFQRLFSKVLDLFY